ncbi:ketose-bisphosphate aldolase class-II family protein [Verticillium alfalfae VaMs.102]|uniref:Ketose-bisphosphate aldolase class-II family protein n=1 Tax=Verticillium alfalfae (strain VaMs.102 / ATCC MYA-4576 / FGSC 10136) TaxID=526221 RepID=C9SN39_VERA1|nr:ketose-bisphosphate aldolase class-II family protein [Verticillium alfalfae VaMs.102]EEY20204.1 ketose-bisphosphate aldolase class-II family protein [Verticillium alfalfae VaMs.102]
MDVFVSGLLAAEKEGRRYLYRTAAAFVSSRLGIKGIPPLRMADVQPPTASGSASSHAGGLILAGSYVPKTTAQLKVLRERRQDKLAVVELEVADLIKSAESERAIVDKAAAEANDQISAGKDILVMTSRTLVKTSDAISSLEIGSKVASALVRLLEQIRVRPRYVIAKGGITSSDAVTKGLKMLRARIMGQAAPGVATMAL